MSAGLFITGTDTGVGKTLVACGLAALLRDSGYRVGVMKPAETGCEERAGRLLPQDALSLKEASGSEEPLDRICPYALREPLAPGVAAERSGIVIDIDRIANLYREISSKHDITIVEGAGGPMVPLLPHFTYADLIGVLKIPVIVVAANRLGALNHLLLTLEHAACRGLRVLGYILNHPDARASHAAETNRDALLSLTAVPCLGEIPYVAEVERNRSSLADLFEQELELKLILERVLPPL